MGDRLGILGVVGFFFPRAQHSILYVVVVSNKAKTTSAVKKHEAVFWSAQNFWLCTENVFTLFTAYLVDAGKLN